MIKRGLGKNFQHRKSIEQKKRDMIQHRKLELNPPEKKTRTKNDDLELLSIFTRDHRIETWKKRKQKLHMNKRTLDLRPLTLKKRGWEGGKNNNNEDEWNEQRLER